MVRSSEGGGSDGGGDSDCSGGVANDNNFDQLLSLHLEGTYIGGVSSSENFVDFYLGLKSFRSFQ